MGLTQLDIIRKQIESTVKNRAAGETAKLRRKTSLIGEISRLAGRANSAIDGAGRDAARRRAGRQPEELEDDAAWDAPDEGARPYICADGYVRRSPEQTLYTRRITGAGCCCGRQGLRRRWYWRWPRCGCWSIIPF